MIRYIRDCTGGLKFLLLRIVIKSSYSSGIAGPEESLLSERNPVGDLHDDARKPHFDIDAECNQVEITDFPLNNHAKPCYVKNAKPHRMVREGHCEYHC